MTSDFNSDPVSEAARRMVEELSRNHRRSSQRARPRPRLGRRLMNLGVSVLGGAALGGIFARYLNREVEEVKEEEEYTSVIHTCDGCGGPVVTVYRYGRIYGVFHATPTPEDDDGGEEAASPEEEYEAA